MAQIKIQDLLAAGVHFGHQTKRWNPKMKPYVYGAKNGISIIDLTKTMYQIAEASNYLSKVVAEGGNVLFVGTKRQAQEIIKDAADKTNMNYVSERWLGGTLTNIRTIRQSVKKMDELDKILAENTVGEDGVKKGKLKKKEISKHTRNSDKLHRNLDGIKNMKNMPQVLVVVDVCNDSIAVQEARKLNIPVIGICDTNADPELVTYPIAANDDAVKSIKVIIDVLVETVSDANEIYQKKVIEEKAKKEAARAKKKEEKEAARAKKKDEKDAKKAPAKKAPAKKAPAKKAAPKKAEEAK
jgi:small subunit ribosomal protein S2